MPWPCRTLIAELRDRLLNAQNDPNGWMPALDAVAGEGWSRLEALLTRLVEENVGIVDAAALHGLRVATRHISNDIFVLQRTVRLLLPWQLMVNEPPTLFADTSSQAGEISAAYRALLDQLPANSSLAELPAICTAAGAALATLRAAAEQLPSLDTPAN